MQMIFYTMLYGGAIKHANLKQGIVLMPPSPEICALFFLFGYYFLK